VVLRAAVPHHPGRNLTRRRAPADAQEIDIMVVLHAAGGSVHTVTVAVIGTGRAQRAGVMAAFFVASSYWRKIYMVGGGISLRHRERARG
jgi:hypothetical protein